MPDHPTGNSDLVKQHKNIQQQGDRDLSKLNTEALPPGKGKPDKEEGVGTTQRRMG